ncbi:aspartate--tRNA ligase [Candidatus Peregrinibacteria bacterium RIFOXYB2_FULL_32_7]|nr:MAG: aspartate--tRNA ligase [Candidatus Peregrinibacteria bacterium RIFOXYB2_FULL_32_7]
MFRTHTCNGISEKNVDEKITLSGWVHRRRDHGGLIFIDLRDRYGITQIVFDPNDFPKAHVIAEKIRPEYVLKVTGKVRPRPSGMTNKNLETGKVEVLISEVEILTESKTPPFEIDQDREVNEEVRLEYRYLDLRRERMKNNIILRHKVIKHIRDFMDNENFLEIETPILIKGTPEGSREYIVPSRLYPGHFYVLPQSPQQLKQLLMVAGMDKYFQIARCFRDEDQRGDRQPEFTQLDIEMSFINEEDIIDLNSKLLLSILEKFSSERKILDKNLPKLTWQEAMDNYGVDKPDLRFDMQIVDLTEEMQASGFSVFSNAIKDGGIVRALKINGGAKFSRKEIDELTEIAKIYEAKGLAYIIYDENGEIRSPILKFLSDKEQKAIQEKTKASKGDIVFFGADKFNIVCASLGHVRLACGDKLNLRDENTFAICWVTDFPMFEFSKEEHKYTAAHHPFTSPKLDQTQMLDTDEFYKVSSRAYDLVLNGNEIGGGSIRIHDPEVQSKVFKALGISKEDAEHRFGHLLKAFQYGAPPHGGIAWGIDRLIMILCKEANIREVIAFPKDQKAKDLMIGAPSTLPDTQIKEANVKVIEK